MKQNNTSGFAYIMVIGTITVLLIIAAMTMRSSVDRSNFTRILSVEKRAEAILESAVDVVMASIKSEMNDPTTDTFYYFFRNPLPLQGGASYPNSSINVKLDISNLDELSFPLSATSSAHPIFAPIANMIDNQIGLSKVDINVECKMIQAEAFSGADVSNYQITGISQRATSAHGESAKFLDNINSSASSDGSLSTSLWSPRDINDGGWRIDFFLPNKQDTQSKTFSFKLEVDVLFFTVKVTIKVKIDLEKLGPGQVKASATVTSPISLGPYSYELNIDEKLKQYFDVFDGAPIAIESLRKSALPESESNPNDSDVFHNTTMKAENFKTEIDNEYNQLKTKIPSIDREDFTNIRQIEKGGILQLTGTIKYYPQGTSGQLVNKKLIAHMPFKVSDVQPVAPEYSFFFSNSDGVSDGANTGLGGALDMTLNTGILRIHNWPQHPTSGKASYVGADGLSRGSTSKTNKVPGMLRINSNSLIKIPTLFGTDTHPQHSQLNALTADFNSPKPFETTPVFQWSDESPKHTWHFPVLFSSPQNDIDPIIPPGLDGLLTFLSTLTAKMLKDSPALYGASHMEYPLGVSMEGYVDMEYASASITVEPKAKKTNISDILSSSTPEEISAEDKQRLEDLISQEDFSPENLTGDDLDFYNEMVSYNSSASLSKFKEIDNSEIRVKYFKHSVPYGVGGKDHYPSYLSSTQWDPDNRSNWPPNLYSKEQYAKKAEFFYDTNKEFWDDKDRFDGTSWDINGVTYIKGDFIIDSDFSVVGKGMIVTRGDITIKADVVHGDNETVFSLIARGGHIELTGGCKKVKAACYSNGPIFVNSPSASIYGNLVVNEYKSASIPTGLDVYYDPVVCRVSPLSVMRDVGKFVPARYRVSMPDNWSRFAYEKK